MNLHHTVRSRLQLLKDSALACLPVGVVDTEQTVRLPYLL